MPVTTLEIPQNEQVVRMMFITTPVSDTETRIDIYTCNEEFMPTGQPLNRIITMNEYDYHIKMREEAREKGHFRPDFSTNPEWNPGYVPAPDDIILGDTEDPS